jgi:DtxR family transcriptional regulator, Mn-dependent transcriptional regulator
MTFTEENYIKAIYKLQEIQNDPVSTNAIALEMKTSAASVTDMLKKLSDKEILEYTKYKGVTLTPKGMVRAKVLIRKHRLWEVFLVEKLFFTWDEVHEIAEQLEHIDSSELVDRLDEFLGKPKFDPHGDPIPDKNGNFEFRTQIELIHIKSGISVAVVGVKDHSTVFLKHLDELKIALGITLTVESQAEYDGSIKVLFQNGEHHIISRKVGQNLLVQEL